MVALAKRHFTAAPTRRTAVATATMCIGSFWLLSMVMMLLVVQQQLCEGRYLPTRSHGDDLDKLRELMLQILESSNEESQRPPNEANGNSLAHRASWLSKLNSIDAMEVPRKFANRGAYESGHYY